MNPKFTFVPIVTGLAALAVSSVVLARGGISAGGGDPAIARRIVLNAEITGPLKSAVFSYLDQFQQNPQMLAEPARDQVKELLSKGLRQDIQNSRYQPQEPACIGNNTEKPAATANGVKNADVCWSLTLLANENPSPAELVGLAMHESARHLGYYDEDHAFMAKIVESQMDPGVQSVFQSEQIAESSTDPSQQMYKYAQAAAAAMDQISAIRDRIQVGQIVAQINSTLNEVQNETLVDTTTTDSKESGGISASLFMLFSGHFGESESRHSVVNTTKLLTVNPQQVASFDQRKAEDFAKMQQQVRQYLYDHITDIVTMKELAAKALQMITREYEVKQANPQISAIPNFTVNQMDALYQAVTNLNFSGEQYTMKCVQVNHIGYTNASDSKDSAAGQFSLFPLPLFGDLLNFGAVSGSLNQRASQTDVHYPYSETNCDSGTQTYTGSAQGNIGYSVDFTQLDQVIQNWLKAATALAIVQTQREPDPKFGSPYYTQDRGNGLNYVTDGLKGIE